MAPEEAGLFGDGMMRYADDERRFALENNLELRERDSGEIISIDFQKRVNDYLAKHENDPNANFYSLEAHFGNQYRVDLIKTREFFALRHQWVELMERMTTTGFHPSEAKALHRDPYADERQKQTS
jgi:hypothetical protein